MTHRNAIPTCTSKVEEALREADDFLSMTQLRAKTGLSLHQVSTTLVHLRNHKAVGSVLSEGRLYWCLSPSTDDRVAKHAQRKQEDRKRRAPRKKLKGDTAC